MAPEILAMQKSIQLIENWAMAKNEGKSPTIQVLERTFSLLDLLAAYQDPVSLKVISEKTGLPGQTRNSITELSVLERELSRARQLGIARDNEELELGVRCMAAGIYDDQNQLVAGLSISAPADRLDESWLAKLQTTAGEISNALGYSKR